jgi:hypothetical protein
MRQVLEAQYGLDSGFTGHLTPLLERFAASGPSTEDWEHLVQALVAAYRTCQRTPLTPRDEARVLLQDVAGELRKIEESLKVLSAYFVRIQSSLRGGGRRRVLH